MRLTHKQLVYLQYLIEQRQKVEIDALDYSAAGGTYEGMLTGEPPRLAGPGPNRLSQAGRRKRARRAGSR